jgi:hypothetical protein
MSISSTLPSVQPVHGEWAQRITAAWQKTVEGVIETGTLLVQAKRWMSPNEFTDRRVKLFNLQGRICGGRKHSWECSALPSSGGRRI